MKTTLLFAATVQAIPNTLDLVEGFLVGGFGFDEKAIVQGNMQECHIDL